MKTGDELKIKIGDDPYDCELTIDGKVIPDVVRVELDVRYGPELLVYSHTDPVELDPVKNQSGETVTRRFKEVAQRFDITGEMNLKLGREIIIKRGWAMRKSIK